MAHVSGSNRPFAHVALWAQALVVQEMEVEHGDDAVRMARDLVASGFSREALLRFKERVADAVGELSRRRR